MARKSPGGAAAASANWLIWLGIACVVVLLDQCSKVLVAGLYALGEGTVVTGFFNIARVHNSGAAFSFLAQASGWQRWLFTGFGVLAAGFMLWLLRTHASQRLFAWALALILGGTVGNVVDRLLWGHVIDFLQFHWSWLAPLFPGGYFPVFNLADSAITLGAALLILDELRRVRRSGH